MLWFYIRLLDSFAIDNRRVVAILDDNESLRGGSVFGHVILGGTAEAATVLDDFAQHGIEISAFVICEPNKERAVKLSNRLESLYLDRGLQLELLAEKLGVLKGTSEAEVRDCPTLAPIFPNINYFRIKRAIEATIATFALLILLPVLILVGLTRLPWLRAGALERWNTSARLPEIANEPSQATGYGTGFADASIQASPVYRTC